MTFSILQWALSWALGKVSNGTIAKLSSNRVDKRLEGAVKSWAKNLPRDRSLSPHTFFGISDHEPSQSQIALGNAIEKGDLPDETLWLAALKDRWDQIKESLPEDVRQGFFLLTTDQATQHLADLAAALQKTCVQEKEIFRPTVLEELKKIRTEIQALQAQGSRGRAEHIDPSRLHIAALRDHVNRKERALRRGQRDFEIRLTQVDSFQEVLDAVNAGEGGRTLAIPDLLSSTPNLPLLLSAPAGMGKTSLLCRMILTTTESDVVPFYIDLGLREIGNSGTNRKLNMEDLFEASLSGGAQSFLSAVNRNAEVLLIVDGMNEINAAIRGSVFSLLADIARDYPTARLVAADRLNSRNIPPTFRNVTILPLAREEVERHLGSYGVSADGNPAAKQLLATPYFLDMQLDILASRGRDVLLGRQELFHAYLREIVRIEQEAELKELSRAAFSAYQKYSMRVFEESWWVGSVTARTRKSLAEAGEIVRTGHMAPQGEMLSFRHQLLHDFLAGMHISSLNLSEIDSEVLDAVTFRSNSLDPLYFASELSGEDADGLLLLIYDWNYPAAISCVSDLERAVASSPVSKDLRVAIAALNAEKLFDVFERSVEGARSRARDLRWAEAQQFQEVSSVEELLETVEQLELSSERYRRWQRLFTKKRRAPFRAKDEIQSLVSGPLEGWTTANVLRRIDLDEYAQGEVRAVYYALRPREDTRSRTNRWRVVHVLGAYPTEENLHLLFDWGLLDSLWVSYGSMRSIVEIASRVGVDRRKAVFKRLTEVMRSGSSSESATAAFRDLYRWCFLAGKQPPGWIEAIEPVLQLAQGFTKQEEEKAEWQSLFLQIERLKSTQA